MHLEQIKQPTHAELIGTDLFFSSLAIDSRKIQAGQLFVAIQGDNLDGHQFIESAIQNGAVAVLASNKEAIQNISVPVLLVKDTTKALGDIAKFYREQFNIPVVGVTGSCGKTTVKGMLGSIFNQVGNPLVTEGNFNNHIGLPLTLLKLTNEHTAAIIEMGASGEGDIAYLCDIAKPNITLINNVQAAHLQGFGSLEGVAKAKGEIYQDLPKDGVAVVNIDDYFAEFWLQDLKNTKTVTFGMRKEAEIRAEAIEISAEGTAFNLIVPNDNPIKVQLKVDGRHNVMNALAATGAAIAAGITIPNIVAGLTAFTGVEGRLQKMRTTNGACLINDTYNANPGSVNAAIEVLAKAPGKRILVLGDMLELGENEISLHQEVGKKAREMGVDQLFTVGKLSQHAALGFGKNGMSFSDKQQLVAELLPHLTSEATCLIKGSRGAKMETIIQDLQQLEG